MSQTLLTFQNYTTHFKTDWNDHLNWTNAITHTDIFHCTKRTSLANLLFVLSVSRFYWNTHRPNILMFWSHILRLTLLTLPESFLYFTVGNELLCTQDRYSEPALTFFDKIEHWRGLLKAWRIISLGIFTNDNSKTNKWT